MKEHVFKIKGIAPLLMNNGTAADPLNPIVALAKPLRSKGSKKQTEEDHIAMSKISWIAALYLDKEPEVTIQGTDVSFKSEGNVIVPGIALKSMLVNAAKAFRLGSKFKPSIFIYDNFPLSYQPQKSVNKIYGDMNFWDSRLVRIAQNRVMKTRPRFDEWELEFVMHYEPGNVDLQQVKDVLDYAGSNVGLLDFRPEFGRFEVVD